MNQRIQRLREHLLVDRYPICVEKIRLVTGSLRQTEGEPQILRRAKAISNYLDHRTIFIEENELIVGNVASKPMGAEASAPTWSKEDLQDIRKQGFVLSDEEEAQLRLLDDYWKGKGRLLPERLGQFYDDERLWPFIQSGILLPPWKKKDEGRGPGAAGVGWGLGLGLALIVVDYATVLNEGLNKMIKDAEEELKNLRFMSADEVKKADFLRAVIISLTAIVRIAERFGDLAAKMASK